MSTANRVTIIHVINELQNQLISGGARIGELQTFYEVGWAIQMPATFTTRSSSLAQG